MGMPPIANSNYKAATTKTMLSPLLLILILLLVHDDPAHGADYVPLAYNVPFGTEECLYERISHGNEHLTASVFVISGDEMASAIVFEGPVAPVDLDTSTVKNSGGDLKKYLDRYAHEGVNMFVQGKFGDNMMNVKPVRIAEMVNFEEEEEDFFDDYHMTEEEREQFNAEHDREHQHENLHIDRTKGNLESEEERNERQRREARLTEYKERMRQERDDNEGHEADDDDDDDGVHMQEEHEEQMLRMIDKEAEIDDDFVVESNMKRAKEATGGRHEQRRLVTPDAPPGDYPKREDGEQPARHRRLSGEQHSELKLIAGEPYQKTVLVKSPGWYRLCAHGKSSPIEVELELRKSSTYGDVDRHTGHVPSWEDVEIHSEIRSLYKKEDDATIIEEEAVLKEDDLRTTREQLRILEKVYGEIVAKQLEERRLLNWRTVKNQHLYSHLVLGNLVETIVYMAITGLQVYTIRRWFSGRGGQMLVR